MPRKRNKSGGNDFSGESLAGVDFSNHDLTEANFSECALTGCDFRNAEADASSFAGASLTGCDFRNSTIRESTFEGAVLAGCDFRNADLTDSDFTDADLTGCDFRNADTSGCTGLDLTTSETTGVNIRGGSSGFSFSGQRVVMHGATIGGNIVGGHIVGDNIVFGGSLIELGWIRFEAGSRRSEYSGHSISSMGGGDGDIDTRIVDIGFGHAVVRAESIGANRVRVSVRTADSERTGQPWETILEAGQSLEVLGGTLYNQLG